MKEKNKPENGDIMAQSMRDEMDRNIIKEIIRQAKLEDARKSKECVVIVPKHIEKIINRKIKCQ